MRKTEKICFFASHFTGDKIPEYTKVYLRELKKHIPEVVLLLSHELSNKDDISFLKEYKIDRLLCGNEGFDFGKWKTAFDKFDLEPYETIYLVNDSCILFAPLDSFFAWADKTKAHAVGITHSVSRGYHIQSYFMGLKKEAAFVLSEMFNKKGVLKTIQEVITEYEVGFAKELTGRGLKMETFMNNGTYQGEFSPYYYCVEKHIKEGVPLIKKKILFQSYRKDELFTLARMNFNIRPGYYIRLIKNANSNLLIEPETLLNQYGTEMNFFRKLYYYLLLIAVKTIRLFRKR